jgi:hypothetical protein
MGELAHELGAMAMDAGRELLEEGMTESSPTEIWFHSAAGESMETEEEPPNMASPMPPLAFSS